MDIYIKKTGVVECSSVWKGRYEDMLTGVGSGRAWNRGGRKLTGRGRTEGGGGVGETWYRQN